MPVELIIGPSAKSMSRTAAERALKQNPDFPADAEYTIATHAGHYIAAISVSSPPPFAGGGPADSSEEAPAPKSEGPDDTEPSEGGESEAPEPSEGGEPKSEGKPGEGGEKKEHSEIAQLVQFVQAIADALGVSLPGAGLDSPVPGLDAAGPAGPPGPPMPPAPPHPAGPPHPPGPGGPGGLGGPGDQHVIHEKSGPPAIPTFSKVEDHPWGDTIGKVAHFRVAEEIGDKDITEVESELQALASAGGFTVSRFREEHEDGRRVASAIIATPKQ